MGYVRSTTVRSKRVGKKTARKTVKKTVEKGNAKNTLTKGMHGNKISTAAYNKRKAFGIPRLPLTKEEFCAIRDHDIYFLTTTVFNKTPDGSKKRELVMITNDEVKALIKYRAIHGYDTKEGVVYNWTWQYNGEDQEGWKKVTEKACRVYEIEMNDKIALVMEKKIVDSGGKLKNDLELYGPRYQK